MTKILRRFGCFVLGCSFGGWLPISHIETLVQAYVRQCKRCHRLEQRGYLVTLAGSAMPPDEDFQ